MKNYFFLLLIVFSSLNIKAQENETTTYYFIRHAEKVRTDKANKNPNLTIKGQERAENWSTIFGSAFSESGCSVQVIDCINKVIPVV